MKKNLLSAILLSATVLIGLSSCSKDDNNNNNTSNNIEQTTDAALSDFVNVLGEPLYADFVTKATTLNTAVQTLKANPTAANQTAAQNAWRDVRVTWEQSEGFLIGPVEDDNYDPYMDTWPTDKNQMNQLLAGTQTLNVEYLESETSDAELTLRGFHPLEYLLWGEFDPADYTSRQKDYMAALAQDILNNTKALQSSWTTGGFANEITGAGQTGSRYTSKEDALEAIANALIDICNEVGETKMPTPFGNTQADADSTQAESPYSHNSIIDFKNNIQGAYNTYICSYGGKTGTSLSSLVQINNKNLDNQLKNAFTNAIAAFDGFGNYTFEQAIYTQRPIVQNVIDQITALKTTVEDGLIPYIQQYIKN
ncbi:imelysin family protein [Arachidicoccus ginsenosidimutans]|uniref:imelysin family protein n=1 Tax=Arachidicoccus sp. BS20 TaxID=1850526 RepID=UPI0018D2F21D|nr:imelysin family protein [Arachidicoccus sp. BS20]